MLDIITALTPSAITIHIDSQAAIKALSSTVIYTKSVHSTLTTLNKLSSFCPVSLVWTPAHTGIAGNELADHLANQGSDIRPEGPIPFAPVTHTQVKNILSTTLRAIHFNRLEHFKDLNNTQQKLMIKLFHDSHNKLRFTSLTDLRILTHLFTGHSYLRQHQFRIKNEQTLVCRYCDEQEETVEHILARCPALTTARSDILGEQQIKVSEIPDRMTPLVTLSFAKRIHYLDILDSQV